ncbi:MAG: hypothetical protein Q7U99_24705 [Rubrivivax sp.]|nr:hypothetical protein [Rubrivivax sp.]MDP3224241.1 hypothetical protein [Rubrivivax sp.]
MPRRTVKPRPAPVPPAAPAQPASVPEQQDRFTSEGAPPPGKVATEPPRLPDKKKPGVQAA